MSLDISVSVSLHDTTYEYELITVIDIYYYKQLIALLGIARSKRPNDAYD